MSVLMRLFQMVGMIVIVGAMIAGMIVIVPAAVLLMVVRMSMLMRMFVAMGVFVRMGVRLPAVFVEMFVNVGVFVSVLVLVLVIAFHFRGLLSVGLMRGFLSFFGASPHLILTRGTMGQTSLRPFIR